MTILLTFLACYLLGAIPFGVIAGKLCGVDVLNEGSKSSGATNVIRTCGKPVGFTVMALDILKGTSATLLAKHFITNEWLAVLGIMLALVGHSLSVFIKFKGGKSAATGIGIILALNPIIFLITGVCTIMIRQITGYQSVASLASALVATILFIVWPGSNLAFITLIAIGSAFVWVKHIPNIKRLLNGTESRIVKKK